MSKKHKGGYFVGLRAKYGLDKTDNKGDLFIKSTSQEVVKSTWSTGEEVDDKIAHDCSFNKAKEQTIMLTEGLVRVIRRMCKEVNLEWQMLLCGEKMNDGSGIILDAYYIPHQEVTGASVKNLDCIDKKFIEENKVLATIHSHADMDVFFSKTDETECNAQTIDYHIVTNNANKVKGVVKTKLPCGLILLADCNVESEANTIAIEGMDRIKKNEARTWTREETWTREDSDKCGFGHGYRGGF